VRSNDIWGPSAVWSHAGLITVGFEMYGAGSSFIPVFLVLSSRLQRSLYILWGDHLATEKTLSISIQISGNLLSLGKSNIRHSVTTMRRLGEAEF
jgi:hypothetical protein